jgi:urease accessory protein
MGTQSARITAADFVTPPELRRWRLAANPAGRIGGLRLVMIADVGGTRLQSCYQQVPLRVLPPFTFGGDQPSLFYLLNPTAGLMDGDGQLVEIRAGESTRAVVVGQSATRIHPATAGFCSQQWHIVAEKGAVLVVLPGPAIPFQGCRYYQRVEIDLAKGADLVWGDIWLAGRYARGSASEWFQFQLLVQDFTVRRNGRLVFRDRFCWRGPWDRETARWHFGEAPACGMVFTTGSVSETGQADSGTVSAAVFPTAFGDACLRWHGEAEAVASCVVGTAMQAAGGNADQWLSGPDLAPNHWFTQRRPAQAVRDLR